MVKKDEVLQQIKQVLLPADTTQHGRQFYVVMIKLRQSVVSTNEKTPISLPLYQHDSSCIPHEAIFSLVDLHKRLTAHVASRTLYSFHHLLVVPPRGQTLQCHAQVTSEHHL